MGGGGGEEGVEMVGALVGGWEWGAVGRWSRHEGYTTGSTRAQGQQPLGPREANLRVISNQMRPTHKRVILCDTARPRPVG